jgi:hypothetical protein
VIIHEIPFQFGATKRARDGHAADTVKPAVPDKAQARLPLLLQPSQKLLGHFRGPAVLTVHFVIEPAHGSV